MKNKVKTAFSTLGCPEWSFERILSEAVRMRFDAVEIRGIGANLQIADIPELMKPNRANTLGRLREAGIGLCSIDCSASFAEDRNSDKAFAECEYAVEAASELNAPFIRVFGDHITDGASVERVHSALSRLSRISDGSGVTVLLEAHGDFNTAGRLSEAVAGTGCGILWDIEHTHHAGESGEKIIAELLPYIKHVHFKDVRANGSLCLPGGGVLGLQNTARMLTDAGYGGYFSLEWEKRWHPELDEPETAFGRYAELMGSL